MQSFHEIKERERKKNSGQVDFFRETHDNHQTNTKVISQYLKTRRIHSSKINTVFLFILTTFVQLHANEIPCFSSNLNINFLITRDYLID